MRFWLILLGGVCAVFVCGTFCKGPAVIPGNAIDVGTIARHETIDIIAPGSTANPNVESNSIAFAALLQALPEREQQRDAAHKLLTELFEKDPVSAAEYVAMLPEPLNIQMASALASLWVQKDAASAIEWVRDLPPSPVRTHALFSLCADWASANPKDAAEFVVNTAASDFPLGSAASTAEQMTDDLVRSQMLSVIGSRWAVNDSVGAIKWATQLPTGSDHDSLIFGIGSTLAEASPAEAATLVASMSAGPKQNDAALTVLLQWARTDLQAAADWLKLFPAGEFREKALLNLTGQLVEQKSDTANKVMLEWPEPAERTKAIREYLNETLGANASRGVAVLMGIEDDSIFHEEILRVAQHWLMQEPGIAQQWIDSTGLDESARERLLGAPGLSLSSSF